MVDIKALVLEEAAKSPCAKRKVGAVIVDAAGTVISKGHNHNQSQIDGASCEDIHGKTYHTVIHAEVMAIDNLVLPSGHKLHSEHTMYISHEPCADCRMAMADFGIRDFIVVEEFIKFDTGKLRYDLVPPSAFEGLARVLTYGAKKYKPNNWRNVEDLDRYVAALYRHIEAWRRGEKLDEESGLKHLEHAITNICFLLELDTDEFGSD